MDETKETGGGHASILDAVLHQQQAHAADMPIEDRLRQLLVTLPQRDREIIEGHFGLFGAPFATLEEIGHRFSITRERVRQIERSSIAVLRKSKSYDQFIRPFEDGVVQLLEESGGAMGEDDLFAEIFGKAINKLGNVPQFIFGELLGRLEIIEPGRMTRKGWRLKLSSWDFIEQTLLAFERIVGELPGPIAEDDLFSVIEKSPYYQEHNAQLSHKVISSFLGLSLRIRKNPFGVWGLAEWPEIVPKRMSDKIYLAMKKRGLPMHFKDIAKAINEFKFDQKIAHPATIHNELIVNRKYVLIGRGIYALKEWGYDPGVVADVIADILQKTGKPLTREQIVSEVLKKRQVKIATIHLALTNKDKFHKLSTGEYALVNQEQNL